MAPNDPHLTSIQKVVEQQAENIDKVVGIVDVMADAIDAKPTMRQTFGITGAIAAVILIVVSVLSGIILNDSGRTQDIARDTRSTTEEVSALLEIIEDCLNPEGECSQANRARTTALQQAIIVDNRCYKEVIARRTVAALDSSATFEISQQCVEYFETQGGIPD